MDGIKGTSLARIFLAYNNSDNSNSSKAKAVGGISAQEASYAKQEAVKVNGDNDGADAVDSRRARVAELKSSYQSSGSALAASYSSKDVAAKISQSLFS